MGNWSTVTHWFECARPGDARAVIGGLRRGRHRWADPERWALRAGLCSPTLVQAESVEKWGVALGLPDVAARGVPDVRVVQLCLGDPVAVGPSEGDGFRLAWNYVVSPAAHDLPAVAATLGGGATCLPAGDRRVLCLPTATPLRPVHTDFGELSTRDDGLGRLLYAIAAADRHAPGRISRHLLGLYTPAHGWVHLAALVLGLQSRDWERGGRVWLEDAAAHNPVHHELAAGPYAHSIYVERAEPVALANLAWPFTA